MKEKIWEITLIFILVSTFIIPLNIEARSGCCSHHGGVCGCGCCDGTPLSAKCAPYYPQCNSRPSPNYTPPPQNNNPSPSEPSNPQNYTAELPKESGGSTWLWIIGIGVAAYIFYYFIKKRKKINP